MAALLVRLRWVVLVAWTAVAVVVSVALPSVEEAQVGALGDLVPRDARSIAAERRSFELFGFPLLSRTILVQRDGGGLSRVAATRAARRLVALNRHRDRSFRRIAGALGATNAIGEAPFAREHATTLLTYLFFRPDVGQEERVKLARRLLRERAGTPDDAAVGVTGAVAARVEQRDLIKRRLPLVELATLLLVVLAVGIHYRSLLAPVVTVAAVAIAYLVSIRLVAFTGEQLGVSVPSEVQPVMVVLLFGVVTDYCIFLLSRTRRLMADGHEPKEAVARATAELAPIIGAAALTVALAMGALAAARLGFLQAFGPGVAVAVLVGGAVAMTFVPAALAVLGTATFWPRPLSPRDADPTGPRRPRRRSVTFAVRHPLATVLGCSALLLSAASGVLFMDLGNPLIRGLPAGNPVHRAYAAASEGLTPGAVSPAVIVVEGRGVAGQRRKLNELQRVLDDQPGVAQVLGPGNLPTDTPLGAAVSRGGDAARYLVVLDTDPLGGTAVRLMDNLRSRLSQILVAVGLAEATASVAGDTALVAETTQRTADDLARVAPFVLGVIFLVMAVLLRALVAPLYLVAASTLALAAAIGLAVIFFQGVLGRDGITYLVPIAAAALLAALGSDYNVFLAGRIWQEAAHRPLRDAVAVGAARAATPITVAGLVLAGSFSLMALVPVRVFQELAFTMAAGLLLDAFVVRTMLVPALVTLVGPVSAWPGRFRQTALERAVA
ncbi:MAG TPA: MMPL family transporter [Solirubrobacteraceae bacterium]|nr:MMPL family transporter [Solirubrobacteraceae bacterium]